MQKHDVLKAVNFGQRVAEDEVDFLSTYFVETDDWVQLYEGKIDIIYGSKGAGKSALYHLLSARAGDLAARNILLATAENPRGATAFQNLITAPPASELEFVGMWKLYFVSLLQAVLADARSSNPSFDRLTDALTDAGLVKGTASLSRLFGRVLAYAKRYLHPTAVEGTVKLDSAQMPSGITGRIVFSDAVADAGQPGSVSVDELLELCSSALDERGQSAWVLLDRLDVAFAEHDLLEVNALRALFRVYLDMLAFKNIGLKIFLRTDIWQRITDTGFREASHITRHLTIRWNPPSLMNLVVKRMLHNTSLNSHFGVDQDLARRPLQEQTEFFYRAFPAQVDVGSNKSASFDWMLARTRDGSKANAPRELIHFLNSLRDTQVKRFETGESPEPEGEQIFARPAFKAALPEVSTVRLQQTLYAEYPSLKSLIERMRGEKTAYTVDTLSKVLGMSRDETVKTAEQLVAVGFFEPRGEKSAPEYWVPFLYRDALDMIQGAAD